MKHLQFWWNIYIFYKILRAIRLVFHLFVFFIRSLSPDIGEIFVKVSSNGTIVILWERYGTSEQAENKRIFQFRCATKNVCLVQIFRLRSFSRQHQKGGQGEARGGKGRQGQTRAHKGKSKQTFGPACIETSLCKAILEIRWLQNDEKTTTHSYSMHNLRSLQLWRKANNKPRLYCVKCTNIFWQSKDLTPLRARQGRQTRMH